jgi:hypothetical protein
MSLKMSENLAGCPQISKMAQPKISKRWSHFVGHEAKHDVHRIFSKQSVRYSEILSTEMEIWIGTTESPREVRIGIVSMPRTVFDCLSMKYNIIHRDLKVLAFQTKRGSNSVREMMAPMNKPFCFLFCLKAQDIDFMLAI